VADTAALEALPEKERIIGERSSKQVFDRLAGTWTYWGWKGGYFDSEGDAQAFFDELRFMLASQMCAPNSPQWFNTGLHWAYGIDGPSQGHHYVDFKDRQADQVEVVLRGTRSRTPASSSRSPMTSSTRGGIMDLWVREARLFKYGSGTGTNFSSLRGENERLGGGGKSSGLMSFLKIGDRASRRDQVGRHHAPRRQDGDRRRRASDIEQFIDWKVKEEQKVAALVTGSKITRSTSRRCSRPASIAKARATTASSRRRTRR